MEFKDNICTNYRRKQAVGRTIQEGNLFRMQTAEPEDSARVVNTKKRFHQWHRRLGDRDSNAIRRLINKELAAEIKLTTCFEEIVCENCITGKLAQTKFRKSEWREDEPMKLIHSDPCGPMQTSTPNGNRYFLMLIDDHSRHTVMRLLKWKDKVPSIIKEYVAMMSLSFERKAIALHTDNGKEYVSSEMSNFMQKEGIEHQLIVAHTP
ncbi:hypothetical protein KM043_013271 [Ampulex compressa]|nr:hypothetical protein KM043_013271 [Ampulex compressa]